MASAPATGGPTTVDTRRRNPLQTAARVTGAVFLLVGILGFIPGITSHFGDMAFAGRMSGAKLLGLFQVSILHNIVHLLYGVAGLLAARRPSSSFGYFIGGGVIYLVLWIYGLVIHFNSAANFVPLNRADNWLHLLLGIGMVAIGAALAKWRRAPVDTVTV